jgi:hypothetical protein
MNKKVLSYFTPMALLFVGTTSYCQEPEVYSSASILELLSETLVSEGTEAASTQYQQMRADKAQNYRFHPMILNNLG